MKCPVCPDSTLAMSNRQGIEIDYCPTCRGVWLDRGELDKIIERTASETAPVQAATPQRGPAPGPQHTPAPPPRYDHDDDRRYQGQYGNDYYHKRKKKGLLGELFDFD